MLSVLLQAAYTLKKEVRANRSSIVRSSDTGSDDSPSLPEFLPAPGRQETYKVQLTKIHSLLCLKTSKLNFLKVKFLLKRLCLWHRSLLRKVLRTRNELRADQFVVHQPCIYELHNASHFHPPCVSKREVVSKDHSVQRITCHNQKTLFLNPLRTESKPWFHNLVNLRYNISNHSNLNSSMHNIKTVRLL